MGQTLPCHVPLSRGQCAGLGCSANLASLSRPDILPSRGPRPLPCAQILSRPTALPPNTQEDSAHRVIRA